MDNNKNALKEKLKIKLKEIFQFENRDLNFGIYRILNYKREEIERFIEIELIDEIKKQLKLTEKEKAGAIKEKVKKTKEQILDTFGKNAFENNTLKKEFKKTPLGKKYIELLNQLNDIKISVEFENDIYNHLITFFSRYYDNGDFISKRRYGKNEKYVVPYNGEEVLLYWPNKDQYYIKTTEYFHKYTFHTDHLTVNFRMAKVEEEKGNQKATDKKFFVLDDNIFDFDDKNKVLNIYFNYRSIDKKEAIKNEWGKKDGTGIKQEKINEFVIDILKQKIPQKSLASEIFIGKKNKSIIAKHLYIYTRRNTTDYFIHKNLKEFLERELDFYIKNEFLQLDDLQVLEQSGFFDKLKLYLIAVKVFKNISFKIIQFLSQIEDFQKKLWEKKKFVIDTHYVITLDKIVAYAGPSFLKKISDEILNNKKQLEEWSFLFGITIKNKKDLLCDDDLTFKDISCKKLPVDTRFFSEEFKWHLLTAVTCRHNLDDILDGILIKSENFQALNLLQNKYAEKIQTIYIDPPFNKEKEAGYLYKVGYKDAAWLTLLENRIALSTKFLKDEGNMFVNSDDNGNMYVRMLLDNIMGKNMFKNEILWCYEKPGGPKDKLKNNHSTIFFYSKTGQSIFNQVFVPRKGETELTKRTGRFTTDYEGKIAPDWWIDIPSFATMMTAGERTVKNFGVNFPTQQPEKLLKRIFEISGSKTENEIIMDYFPGSATSLAVAQKMRKKWIGVELGEHFWNIILPRMKKAIAYDKSGISKDKDIKEIYNPGNAGGFFKYHMLEQYEDTLENIDLKSQNDKQQKLLSALPEYFVKYMLDWETKNNQTFLNLTAIKNPFDYKLKITENYRQKTEKTDVIETFNYLLGLKVNRYKVLTADNKKYVFVLGEKEGNRLAVIWRDLNDLDLTKDKEIIEKNIKDFNPDEIYINGDAIVKEFKAIEPVFKSLIF